MEIKLSPELERVVAEDVARGGYANAEEYVACAVGMLHEQEEWFVQNREEIAAAIEEGLKSAEGGERFTETEVRAEMAALKRVRMERHRQAA